MDLIIPVLGQKKDDFSVFYRLLSTRFCHTTVCKNDQEARGCDNKMQGKINKQTEVKVS